MLIPLLWSRLVGRCCCPGCVDEIDAFLLDDVEADSVGIDGSLRLKKGTERGHLDGVILGVSPGLVIKGGDS